MELEDVLWDTGSALVAPLASPTVGTDWEPVVV